MADWIRTAAGGLLGYLIGTVSPAYFLGRLLSGIDIRAVNYRNAGTRNVRKTLGLIPAVLTAAIDTTKGVAAVALSTALLDVHGYGIIAPAVCVVIGHIFPFYLQFRGGRGVATAVGLFIAEAVTAIADGTMPVAIFVALLGGAGLVYVACRSGDATALFAFVAMVLISVLELGFTPHGIVALIVSSYALVHSAIRGRDTGLYDVQITPGGLGWRVVARPFALLFVPLNIVIPRPAFLTLLSALAGAALLLDVFRVIWRRRFARVYRAGERRRLSSITLFLVSTLLLFVLFRPPIAYTALAYLTIGDLSGKLMGVRFGRHEWLAGRTGEGSVGFLVGAALAGYAVARVVGEPALLVVMGGALAAAVIEQLTMGFDDNLTVGLGSAGVLTLLALL